MNNPNTIKNPLADLDRLETAQHRREIATQAFIERAETAGEYADLDDVAEWCVSAADALLRALDRAESSDA